MADRPDEPTARHGAAREPEATLVESLALAQQRLRRQENEIAAAQARTDALQATLDAREAAHRQALRMALDAREAAFRDDLGTALAVAVKLRGRVRAGATRIGRQLRQALRLPEEARWGKTTISRRRRDAALCRRLFDRGWYVEQNPDVAAAGARPLRHYLTRGWTERRDPHPLFDTSWYLEQNSDVAAAKLNPLAHFLERGASEGRDPSPLFHTAWYLQRYPDVAAAGINPLLHYINHGAAEGRDPNELFDTDWYLEHNPDVAATGINPLTHYIARGAREGRDPHELFDTDWYLESHPEVAAAGTNPLAHYLLERKAASRLPLDPGVAYARQVIRERQRLALEMPELLRHIEVMLFKPAFVVILEGPDGADRARTVGSLQRQIYPHWSTCELAGDRPVPDRITVSGGTYLLWVVAGDVLDEKALYAFASALNEDPSVDLVYADEDRVELDGKRSRPFYKPAWSPDYLESFNYIGPAACFRSSLAVACWPHPAQSYDFVLRFTERSSHIRHIREVLYHRRRGPTEAAFARQIAPDIAALQDRLRRSKRNGGVAPLAANVGCYDIKIALSSTPRVSIVIPTAGKIVEVDGRRLDLLANCLNTITQRSTYKNIEFVIVDNGDLGDSRVAQLRQHGCKTITFGEEKFNISKKLNLGASIATGEMLLLLNDDIEPISADWIERLLEQFEKPHVGVVGAKLLYPDGKTQHVGVVTAKGVPDHVRRLRPRDDAGYFFSTCAVRNFFAVTGACMMTRAEVYRRIGGYDESLAISYNDIDYCLKVRESGLTVVYAPGAELTHFESRSRVAALDRAEFEYFQRRWAHMLTSDPYYNQNNLSVESATFEIRYNLTGL